MTALFCSTLFRKSSTSLMCTYLIIGTLFLAPIAASVFTQTFARGTTRGRRSSTGRRSSARSPPRSTCRSTLDGDDHATPGRSTSAIFWGFVAFRDRVQRSRLLAAMMQLFKVRWRISE